MDWQIRQTAPGGAHGQIVEAALFLLTVTSTRCMNGLQKGAADLTLTDDEVAMFYALFTYAERVDWACYEAFRLRILAEGAEQTAAQRRRQRATKRAAATWRSRRTSDFTLGYLFKVLYEREGSRRFASLV